MTDRIYKGREERNKRFVDHLDSEGLQVGSYIAPGVVTTEKFEISVLKKVKGASISSEQILEKSAISAVA